MRSGQIDVPARRPGVAILAALLAGAVPLAAQSPGSEAEGAVCPDAAGLTAEVEGPLATVRYLADDALQGRLAGSTGERCAGEFLAGRFEAAGLLPAGEDAGWFQSVPLASATNPHAAGGTGRNVVALLPGSDPELGEQVVVVGAHYDHLGTGGFGSLGEEGEIHNGADDNASGVAALLEAARSLAAGPRPARSVLFVAFTGEELGLLGSSHYAKNPSIPLERTIAMVNLDMVGRLAGDPLIVYGLGTAPEWEEILATANREVGLELAVEDAGYGPSDHTSFYSRDVPVLHFFTNVHSDYHKPSDDWEKVDGLGVERVARLVSAVVREVAGREERLVLIRGAGVPEQRAEGYGAYLGTIPDFTPVDHGVLLSGVSAGSPAEKAGMASGDILVGLGEHDVADLYGLTDALRAHKPGDSVTVTVLRDGETLRFQLVLGSRSDR